MQNTSYTWPIIPENNNVVHPKHYNEGNIETWDYIQQQNLNFFLGNAVKYISRAGKKDSATYIEDLQKAINYLQKEIQIAQKEANNG